jgi:glycosyltransferase involved in cell wall biosynthesis
MKNNLSPFFSIITVTYNSSKFVRDAIESVLASTYTNFEYIIGDDCSMDNTWEIIQEYEDPRIVKYRNETNLNEYPNRNKAISIAKGQWILFIDGDDFIYPHGLDVFHYYISRNEDASIFIQKNYLNNVIWPIKVNPTGFLINDFFGSIRLSSSSFASNVFKRDILNHIGNLSTEFKTGDEDIRLRFGAITNTVYIPGWLTWPRETPGQASKNISNAEMLIERSKQILKLKESQKFSSELTEIIELGHKKMLQQVKRSCFSHLIKLNITEIYVLVKYFGLKNIILSKNVDNMLTDFLRHAKPERPLR